MNLLLSASDKKAILREFDRAFEGKSGDNNNSAAIAAELGVAEGDLPRVHAAVGAFIRRAVYESLAGATADDVQQLFGADSAVDPKLQALAATIVAKRLPAWQASSAASSVSLPRLENVRWRCDLEASSGAVDHAKPEPRALVQVQTSKQVRTFEVSRNTMATLVDAMHEISALMEATAGNEEQEDE